MIKSEFVYYGISEEERKCKYIEYEYNPKYNGKGVNLDLKGLRKFIKDSNLDNEIKYYFITSLDNFVVIDDIYQDEKYNMVTVKMPFKVLIGKVHKLFD